MKDLIKYALVAVLAAEASANPHHHRHRHIKRDAVSPFQQDRATKGMGVIFQEVVKDDNGNSEIKPMDENEARKCLKDGTCYPVTDETSNAVPNPPQRAPASSSQAVPPPLSAPIKDSPPPPPPNDFNREFQMGNFPCSELPPGYGLVPITWQKDNGWAGIQNVTGYNPDSDQKTLPFGLTPPDNKGCTEGLMCSYVCPPGLQKTQWLTALGTKNQSIGGLYCNSNNKLQLTRPSAKSLCEKGVGGVFAYNNLDRNISICRTDYPGTEKMVVPTVVGPGQMVELTNPDQTEYLWQAKKTSAHYYLNPLGVNQEEACVWDSPDDKLKDKAGDKAPVVLGTGFDPDAKASFLSVASNNPRSAIDFKIVIRDGTSTGSPLCEYEEPTPTAGKGCTVSLQEGKVAVFSFE
ncbi:beta-glucosidase (SUN family) domain-containing protein [Hirsutella rhossiliensis]|uniref:Beta-glucosidase (SUN family) domain-containing protein n=1 Tax=Hirsutella rhossiliensis TaxID=111463 RepID=A0A9P8MUF8_9HYPO|nr:beta-glucosidase (SUN family) domain-containing protein [Hirsutella rhossiliensis]KAH0960644.1 beta-glucosidase (SUN family) domain-containing protein [Hirsutella rhossiliensis]